MDLTIPDYEQFSRRLLKSSGTPLPKERLQMTEDFDIELEDSRHQSEISTVDVDLDNSYAEDLRKNFVVPNSQQKQPHRELENLDLDQYASSLDELSKRLMNMKRNKTLEDFKKNDELEAKLTQLSDNVNMFTQMFQSMAKLSEANKNWSPTQYNSTALQYDNLIKKLLLGFNQVPINKVHDLTIPDYEEFSRRLLKSSGTPLPKERLQMTEDFDIELEDSRHQSEISTVDVDLDNSYAEDLRKNFVVPNSQQKQPHRELENLDLDQYASSLDELSKRLMNMKRNKTLEDFKKNDENSYAEDLRKNFVVPNSQQKQPHRELENLDLDQYASSLDELSKRLMNMKRNKTLEDFKKNDENSYAEDLRKNFVVPNSQQKQPHRELENLDLDQYASSLDELSKRLMNMKRNKTLEDFKKNDELEAKLTQLSDNVNMFTQMFQSMAKLSEANKNWSPTQYNSTALQYDNLIKKLLLGFNQVTYLQNFNILD